MSQKILLSYSQSPLYYLHSHWDDSFVILNEKFNEFSKLEGSELWLDTYIDLYDPKLINPEYLYQFFARIHQICDQTSIPTIRMLRNFSYESTQITLNKVLYLYHSFVNFFTQAYNVYPIYIPDILNASYKNHPYLQLKNSTKTEWSKESLFRVIQGEDVITNLIGQDFNNETLIIKGMKVSLIDLYEKINQIFGTNPLTIENAYKIIINEPKEGLILSELNYNLEAAFIHQL